MEWLWPDTSTEEKAAAAVRSASFASFWIVLINFGMVCGYMALGRSMLPAGYADAAGIAIFILFMRAYSGSLLSALFALAAVALQNVALFLAVKHVVTSDAAPGAMHFVNPLAPVFLAGAIWGVRGSLILKSLKRRRSGWLAAAMDSWWPDLKAEAAAMGGVWALLWLVFLNGLTVLPALIPAMQTATMAAMIAKQGLGLLSMPVALVLAFILAASRSLPLAWIALIWIAGDTALRLAGLIPAGAATPLNMAFSGAMVLAALQGVRGCLAAATLAPAGVGQTGAA